jgi:hypothetical protein
VFYEYVRKMQRTLDVRIARAVVAGGKVRLGAGGSGSGSGRSTPDNEDDGLLSTHRRRSAKGRGPRYVCVCVLSR